MQLTNADRKTLLDNFRELAHGWAGDDAELIAWATGWAASLSPTFGYESGLARDVFFLGDILRKAEAEGESARLARGGLAYLHQNNPGGTPSAGPFGLLDDSFVAGYAAHSIREKCGADATYLPPGLTPEEMAAAESMFVELWGSPESDEGGLPERADAALADLGHLAGSGLFRRLRLNVSLLSRVLLDSARLDEHRQIARAALHYVVAENDVIPDTLGLIGFLDDFFIAELAVGFIDDDRAPWMDLIDALVASWPFLNMTVFGNELSGSMVSEFLMANAALACPSLRGTSFAPLTHLVLPATGPLPLLLACFASLGQLQSSRTREGAPVPFEVGQKVLVDGKSVRTFLGCRIANGRSQFGLGKTYTEKGNKLHTNEYWPIENLSRLTPASAGRVARGRVSLSASAIEPLGALDYLFLTAEAMVVPQDLPQVVVVTPAGRAQATAEAVSLYGYPMSEVLPMGHLTSAGDVISWSPRFGDRRSAILIVSDLDKACEYVEEVQEAVTLIVVDASGHNAGRLASLNRLIAVGGRVLVAVPEVDAESVLEGVVDPVVWEWTRDDYETLCFDTNANEPVGPLQSYERELVRAATASIEVVRVETPGAEETYRSLTTLKQMAEARGEEVSREVGDALGRSWSAFLRLIRCPFRLSAHPKLEADLSAKLDAIVLSEDAKNFLSPQETEAIADVQRRLRTLLAGLRDSNSKEDALSAIRKQTSCISVVCGDVSLLHGADKMGVVQVASSLAQLKDGRDTGHAFSGWFGTSMMDRLLRPPFASPLYLVLCEPENIWYAAFLRRVREASSARSRRARRERFFPGLGRWPESSGNYARGEPSPADVDASETIETFLVHERRRRLVDQSRPTNEDESVQGRLVKFEGGHAFFTDDYRAKVATHLSVGPVEGEDAVLRLVPVAGLRRDDLLLFLRGSSSDVIRQTADRSLAAGDREQAALWRRTLLTYRREVGCSIEAVWKGLREKGCPLSSAAIENWFTDENMISPASIDRELKAILELTNSEEFRAGLETCRESIRRVRGAHLKASREIARRVIDRAVAALKATTLVEPVDLGEGIVLARVTEIDEGTVIVRQSVVNRLLEDQP